MDPIDLVRLCVPTLERLGIGYFIVTRTVFEDQNGIGCWCLAKERIIEFYLSRDENDRTTSVVLVYDSGKIAVAHRRKAGNADGDVNPGEVYQFVFRNTDDAQRFIRQLLAAVTE